MEKTDLKNTVDLNHVKAVMLDKGWDGAKMAEILECRESTFKQKMCLATTWTLDDLVALSKASQKPLAYFILPGAPGGAATD